MTDSSQTHPRLELDPVVLLNVLFLLGVLILHHRSYTRDYLSFISQLGLDLYLQQLVVGGFLFLSGYKLTCSKRYDPFWSFITNRLWKIYVPYLIALVVFAYIYRPVTNDHLQSSLNFFVHFTCLQSVLPNLFQRNYPTIWFVSILFCCYAFFLTARTTLGRWRVFLTVTSVLLLFVWTAHHLSAAYGVEVFCRRWNIYLCYFAAGMLFAAYREAASRVPNRLLWALFTLGFVGLRCLENTISVQFWYEQLTEFGLLLLSIVPLYVLAFNNCQAISVSNRGAIALSTVSYSTYSAFLLHRPIWTVMNRIWSEQSTPQWLFIVPVGVAIILVFSFACQRSYDSVLRTFRGRMAIRRKISDRLARGRAN